MKDSTFQSSYSSIKPFYIPVFLIQQTVGLISVYLDPIQRLKKF